MRVLAVDWSGALAPSQQRRSIWVAEALAGSLLSLAAGRTRDETVDHLLEATAHHPDTLIGLDFAFSFPEWWMRRIACADGPAVWEMATKLGEEWLAACQPPFWGRPGRGRPRDNLGEWRRTERDVPSDIPGAHRPKSVFQIGGAGSVGTGSIRGMPALLRLRAHGVAIWPWDPWPAPGDGPVAAEVYPRWCTGPVRKSRAAERVAHLDARWPDLPAHLATLARASEDAFDAACSALVMSLSPPPSVVPDHIDRIEGRVLPPAPWAAAEVLEGVAGRR